MFNLTKPGVQLSCTFFWHLDSEQASTMPRTWAKPGTSKGVPGATGLHGITLIVGKILTVPQVKTTESPQVMEGTVPWGSWVPGKHNNHPEQAVSPQKVSLILSPHTGVCMSTAQPKQAEPHAKPFIYNFITYFSSPPPCWPWEAQPSSYILN